MDESIYAKEEVARMEARERRTRIWNRVWPWLAIAAALLLHLADRWWIKQQSVYERIEREQQMIKSQEKTAMMCGLPRVVFVLQGTSVKEVSETLQSIEREALLNRMDLNQEKEKPRFGSGLLHPSQGG